MFVRTFLWSKLTEEDTVGLAAMTTTLAMIMMMMNTLDFVWWLTRLLSLKTCSLKQNHSYKYFQKKPALVVG